MPPLVLVAIAWVAGLIAARHWLVPAGVEPLSLALLCLLPLAAFLLWREDRSMRLSSACALALLLAALRYQAALPNMADPSLVAHYNDQGWATIEGVVRDYPDVRDTWTNLRLEAESLAIQGQARPVRGTVLVRAPRLPEYRYGDRLRVTGPLETPPELEGFSYRAYLERKGVYSWIPRPQIERLASGQGSPFWTILFAVKDRARDAIARLVPEPEASLLQGIVLGVRSGIPADLYDQFNATGTSHIIVISGANITLVAVLFSRAFGRMLGKRRAYWFTLAGIVLYVLLVGADAAVVRAGAMGGLLVTALYLGRQATAYVSLCASAIVLTAINPLALWDAGFQLSFAATLSLILFTPALERLFEGGLQRALPQERARQALRYLNDALIVTLAAQILTLPLVVCLFGRLSLVAPLANLLILPVQPLVMSWGGATALASLVPWLPAMEAVSRAIAWVPWLCLAYTVAVVRWLAAWPFASIPISQANAGWFVLSYSLILGAAWAWHEGRETARRAWAWLRPLRLRPSTAALLGVPLAAAILGWLAVLHLPDGKLHVAVLDVGQGDAILITSPLGQQILVDGGPSPAALTSALGHEMPFWDRSLDLVVMTHPDADHITGLVEVLRRFQVGGWLDNGQPDDDPISVACQELLAEAGTPHHAVHAGDRLDLGEGLVLQVLHPPPEPVAGTAADTNNNSLVLRLVWQGASFLLTGDLEADGERLLLGSGQALPADVLKVAHHGSGGSSTAPFLAAVDPAYAVLSVGAGNPFGHPAQAVLDRLGGLGVTVLRTDKQGTVEFVTDGQRLWIRTER
jgi:competence protein ComEC